MRTCLNCPRCVGDSNHADYIGVGGGVRWKGRKQRLKRVIETSKQGGQVISEMGKTQNVGLLTYREDKGK